MTEVWLAVVALMMKVEYRASTQLDTSEAVLSLRCSMAQLAIRVIGVPSWASAFGMINGAATLADPFS